MIYFLTIFHYFFAALVDGLDKFLISRRKILPASYAFWTVVTGLLVVLAWPWVYESIAVKSIILDVLSGVLFSLAIYVFFKAISWGEVSRVVPFIFGIAPVFDMAISFVTGRNLLSANEAAAISLLIPEPF